MKALDLVLLGLVVSEKNVFENCLLKTYLFNTVTYICNQSEPFERVWLKTTHGPFLLSLVIFPLAVQERKSFEVFLI